MKKHDILLFGTIVGAAVSVLASSVGASMVTEDAAVPTAADSADYIKPYGQAARSRQQSSPQQKFFRYRAGLYRF